MTRTIIEARLTALHREAAMLEADGKCAAHLDREIAALEASNDDTPEPFADNDDGQDRCA
ncbi:MAG: hypothetical protein V4696_01655 [Pseudomonadota bacterium]